MKLFGGFIAFGEETDSEFPISNELLEKNGGDVWKIVDRVDEVQRAGLMKGVYVIRVKSDPDRVCVIHNSEIDKETVRKALVEKEVL
jgi:hypothetical protein